VGVRLVLVAAFEGWEPLLGLVVVGVLAVLLRWTFRRGGSLVAHPARPGREDDYGLLVAVSTPRSSDEGAAQVRILEQAGLRANLVDTVDGPRVLVFSQDLARAREALDAPP
jgi:hypothetical protein